MYTRGSEWRKWDLHVHTPMSILNNGFPMLADGAPNWEKYIDALENAGEIGVLGVTDYFTIEGYKFLKKAKEDGRLANIHALLPNIEFRISDIVEGKHVNFHVIFSEDVDIRNIEDDFLHDLDFAYEKSPTSHDYKMRLKSNNLKILGEKLKDEESTFTQRAIEVGAMNAIVKVDDITKKLKNDPRFEGKYLLVLSEEIWAEIPWSGQDHHTRKTLIQLGDMLFSSNSKTIEWCLARNPYMEGVDAYIKEFRTLKPCIHGSDAHNLNEILKPCALRGEKGHSCSDLPQDCEMRYCWVKANPGFEGLKQLLYEPEDRVKVQPNNPAITKSGLSLEMIKMEESKVDDTLTINRVEIPLNSDLVAVTGAKGAGKTAFVDLIANCYEARKHSKDNNSFIKRIAGSNPDLKSDYEIVYKNRKKFKKDILDDQVVDFADLTYIAQSELEDYISKNGSLSDKINEVLFNSHDIKDSELEYKYNSVLREKKFCSDRLIKMTREIVRFEKKTNDKELATIKTNAKKLEEILKDKKGQLAEFEDTLSKEKISAAQLEQKKVEENKEKKKALESTIGSIRLLREKVEYELPSLNSLIRNVNNSLNELGIKTKVSKVDINLEEYEKTASKITVDLEKELTKAIRELKKSQDVIQGLESSTKKHAELSSEIQEINYKINEYAKRQEKIACDKKDMEKLANDRDGVFAEMVRRSLEQRDVYQNISESFSLSKGDILKDVEFSSSIDFDVKTFFDFAYDIFDSRSAHIGEDDKDDTHGVILSYNALVVDGAGEKEIKHLINELHNMEKSLETKLKRSATVTKEKFLTFLYGDYLRVIPKAKYKGIDIEKLSLGQKATVLIKVYLAQGEEPIVIDSHDDHLDNAFIMDELVTALREAKKHRQVILVSNNGNAVINSDADQVIIAEKNGSNIEYISGALEDVDVRLKALKVLEGGEYAFRKRQDKYRL